MGMAALRRAWVLTVMGVVLTVSSVLAAAPTVTVALIGPDDGWYDDDLTFSASGGFSLEGDTQQEVTDGEASVSDEYLWSYTPAALVSGGGHSDSYVTVRYSEQQAGQTYTVSVTYTVTVTYADDTSDSGSASASKDVFIKGAQLSVTSNKSTICTGGCDSPVHRAVITVALTGKDGLGVAGKTVSLCATHDYNQIPPSFSQVSVVTGEDGKVETVLTSGDGIVAGDVRATCETLEASTRISFDAPAMEFEVVDPVTGLPLEVLIADGESQAKVILHETFEGADVPGHGVQWSFAFWAEQSDPDGDPDYTGTAQEPYGSVAPTSTTTDSGGVAYTIYTVGTVGGWVEVWADDQNAFVPSP